MKKMAKATQQSAKSQAAARVTRTVMGVQSLMQPLVMGRGKPVTTTMRKRS
jgi:hypothetical protein